MISTNDALWRTRQAIRSAAATARNAALLHPPRRPHELRQTAVQTIRALHRRDAYTLRRELDRWPAIRPHVHVAGGAIRITDEAKLYDSLGKAALDPVAMFAPPSAPTDARAEKRPALHRWGPTTRLAQEVATSMGTNGYRTCNASGSGALSLTTT